MRKVAAVLRGAEFARLPARWNGGGCSDLSASMGSTVRRGVSTVAAVGAVADKVGQGECQSDVGSCVDVAGWARREGKR